MFLMLGITFSPRCTVCATIFIVTLALTLAAPAAFSASITARRIGSIWLAAG